MKQYFAITLVILAIISMGFSNSVAQAQKSSSTIKHADDFDDNTVDVFNELFKECPAGTVLYKLNGEMVIVCMIDSNNKLIVNDVNIHVENNDDNDNDKKGHDHKRDHGPDHSCLFNVNQPKCAPDKEGGNCPDGFNMNEDGRCFPDHSDEGCPSGYHGTDDDETGQCYNNNNDCPEGTQMNEEGNNCGNTPEEPTPLQEVANSDITTTNEKTDDPTVDENDQILQQDTGDEQPSFKENTDSLDSDGDNESSLDDDSGNKDDGGGSSEDNNN